MPIAFRDRFQILLVSMALTTLEACMSRSQRSASELDIVGGQDIPDSKYPGVIEIQSEFTDADAESCTATVIAPQVILTAGHCVWHQSGQARSTPQRTAQTYDPSAPWDDLLEESRKRRSPFEDDKEEATQNPGARTVSVRNPIGTSASSSCFVIPKGWGLESGGGGSRFDVALVFFNQPLPFPVVDFYKGTKSVGMPVTYVGYGWKHKMGEDSHMKRTGQNVIADLHPDGVIYTYGLAGAASTGVPQAMVRDGDSGGPLLIDGKLAGVASALLYGQERNVCIDPKGQKIPCVKQVVDIGYHVDINVDYVKKFIETSLSAFASGQIKPADPAATCTPREKSKFLEKIRRSPL